MVPLSRKITMDSFRGSDGRGRDLRSSLHYYLCYFLLYGILRCISAAFRRITRIFFDGITDGDSRDDRGEVGPKIQLDMDRNKGV